MDPRFRGDDGEGYAFRMTRAFPAAPHPTLSRKRAREKKRAQQSLPFTSP